MIFADFPLHSCHGPRINPMQVGAGLARRSGPHPWKKIAAPGGNRVASRPQHDGTARNHSPERNGRIMAEWMDPDEFVVFGISIFLALLGLALSSTSQLHRLHFRNNPGIGLVKLAVWLSIGWVAFVLWRYADPSVTGIYIWFYLVMGLAAVKLFGQAAGGLFVRFRVDVCERKNFAGALLLAAFVLATGLIFGGSLWGEADPHGEDEGGWWIPLGFFLLGWVSMVLFTAIFFWREPGSARLQLLQERSWVNARAGAIYLFGLAVILTDAVAGDFYGWWHGLMTFGLVGAMLLAHELSMVLTRTPGGVRGPARTPRWLESGFYLVCALASWGTNRILDKVIGPGL
jgi:hypothetical protein